MPNAATVRATRPGSGWLGGSRLGFAVMALIVGALAGLGAAAFRWLIFAFTWVATGYRQFGQQGHIGSTHFPGLGIWFVLLVPVDRSDAKDRSSRSARRSPQAWVSGCACRRTAFA